jgi:hypothetical protein
VFFASNYPAHSPNETRNAVLRAGFTQNELRAVFSGDAQVLLDKEAKVRKARADASKEP